MKKIYNKLIRDNIPGIIESVGKKASITTLNDETYIEALNAKLAEEVEEWLECPNLEELADIIEVVKSLAVVHGSSLDEVLFMADEKRTERGGFEKRLFLEWVE